MRLEKRRKAAERHQQVIEEDKGPLVKLNMKEIIQKAEIRKWGKAKEKVNLQHLSPDRNKKKAKYLDEVSFFKE